MYNEKKAGEEDDYDVPSKDKNIEGEYKCVKVALFNDENSD